MEQPRTPKSLAYANLGRFSTKYKNGKERQHGQSNSIGGKRNSAGNIYEQIIGNMHADHHEYIKDLVAKNKGFDQHRPQNEAGNRQNSRTKNRQKQKIDLRQARNTIENVKNKSSAEYLVCQDTPKTNDQSKNQFFKRQSRQEHTLNSAKTYVPSSKPKNQRKQNFLQDIDKYLMTISREERISNSVSKSKLIHIQHDSQVNYKTTSQLESSMQKIKQLKLKNHLLQKQQAKYQRKQRKMKQSMYQMLDQIKYLGEQLARQKRSKRKLQKIIQNFQSSLRRCKPERKTLEKFSNSRNIRNILEDRLDQEVSSSNSQDFSVTGDLIDGSWRNKSYGERRQRKSKDHRKYDEQKIENLFKSKYCSDSEND